MRVRGEGGREEGGGTKGEFGTSPYLNILTSTISGGLLLV